ncbi:CDP-alcohol phosphatidyltransferase family protein [Flavobacterium sp.]
MSKLAHQDKFLDLSDYGRPFGRLLANLCKNTFVTPVHITLLFGIAGLCAIYFMLNGYFLLAGTFMVLKSMIDAADGELARMKKTPSYFGRYLDSVFDIILNFLFLSAIGYITKESVFMILAAFFCIQLQGTLYNYYYVILRNNSDGGDKTSKIFEIAVPKALPGESQKSVTLMFKIYQIVYGIYDKIIYSLDSKAFKVNSFPNWFMTLVSLYGLGFQLLIIAVMLATGYINYVIPFLIYYSALIFVLIYIRKNLLKQRSV